MAKSWGESFLKSGLPLEHLAAVTFRQAKWTPDFHFEYERNNVNGETVHFEIDIIARQRLRNVDTWLELMVECKYHDESRFWFFHPFDTQRDLSDYRFLSTVPFATLSEPERDDIHRSASLSYWGVVVSADGQKQDNTIHTAIEQLAHAFMPFVRVRFSIASLLLPDGAELVNAVIVPLIVTNARIYRLRPDVSDLTMIRNAAQPGDIADELPWTWCHHQPSEALRRHNKIILADIKKRYGEIVQPADAHLRALATRPNWFAIVNIQNLSEYLTVMQNLFESTAMIQNRRPNSR